MPDPTIQFGTANWKFTGGTNYNDKSGSVAIVINKAEATVNVTGYTGTYDAVAHGASGSANYNDKSGSVAIVITKADAIVTVSGWSGTYDGSAHGATGTAKGAKGEDLSASLDLGSKFTDVPGRHANLQRS